MAETSQTSSNSQSSSITPNVVFLGGIPIYKSQGETYQKALAMLEVQKEFEKEIAKNPNTPYTAQQNAISNVQSRYSSPQSPSQASQTSNAVQSSSQTVQSSSEAQIQRIQGVITKNGQPMSGLFTPEYIIKEGAQIQSVEAVKTNQGFFAASNLEQGSLNKMISSINQQSTKYQTINNAPLQPTPSMSSEQQLQAIAKEKGVFTAEYTRQTAQPDDFQKTLQNIPIVGGMTAEAYKQLSVGRTVLQEGIQETFGLSGVKERYEAKTTLADIGKATYSSFVGAGSAMAIGYGVGTIGGIGASTTVGVLPLSEGIAATGHLVKQGAIMTGFETAFTAGSNVIQGKPLTSDFDKILTIENVGKNIIIAPASEAIGMKVIGAAGLPSTAVGAGARAAVSGAITSQVILGTRQASEGKPIETDNAYIHYYEDKPFVQAALIGGAISGVMGGVGYYAQEKGYNLRFLEGEKVQYINKQGEVVQETRGLTILQLEKLDTTGKGSNALYGLSVMREGASLNVGEKAYVWQYADKPLLIGGATSEFGKQWYGFNTPEMKAVQKAYFTSKGIDTEGLRSELELKFGKEQTDAIIKGLQDYKGYLAGSQTEKMIIRSSGLTQSEYNPRLGQKAELDLLFVEKSPSDIAKFAKVAGIENLEFKGGSPLAIKGTIDTSYKFTGTLKGGGEVDITVVNWSPVSPSPTGVAGSWTTSFSAAKSDIPALSAKSLISMKSSTVALDVGAKEYRTYEAGKEKYLIDFYTYSKATPQSEIETSIKPGFAMASLSPASSQSSTSVSKITIPSPSQTLPSKISIPSPSKISQPSTSVSSNLISPISVSSFKSGSSSSQSKSPSSSPDSDSSSFSVSISPPSPPPSSPPSSPISSSGSSSSSYSSSITVSNIIIEPPVPLGGLNLTGGWGAAFGQRYKPSSKQKWKDLLSAVKANVKMNVSRQIFDINLGRKKR